MRLLEHQLGGSDPGNGVDTMVLAAPVAEPLGAVQAGLLPGTDGTAARPEKLVDLVDRLDNRVGRVLRPEPVEGRIPAGAVALRQPFAKASAAAPTSWPPTVPRPHRLDRKSVG